MHRSLVLAAFALLSSAGGLTAQETVDESPPRVARPEARSLAPQKIHDVDPVYTDAALAAGIQGVVTLEVTIDEEGRVRQPLLLDGLGYGLDEAAIAAVSQVRFKPAVEDGRPVAVRWRLTQNFRLPMGYEPARRHHGAAPPSDCPAVYATLPELFERAATVFLGRVRDAGPERGEPIAIPRQGRPDVLAVVPEKWRARVEVLEVFKGSEPEEVRVFEREPVSDGHVRLEPSARYLFFAQDSSWPTVCSGTQRVGEGGFERGNAWVGALRELAEEGGSVPASPWSLDSSCVARLGVGSRDGGYVRFAFHRVGSERARVLVSAEVRNLLALRPAAIELELGRDSYRLRRPWEVWGSPPGDVIWSLDSWALEASAGTQEWSSLTSFQDIGVAVLLADGDLLFRQSLDAGAFERAWNAAASCEPAPELGSSFVFGR